MNLGDARRSDASFTCMYSTNLPPREPHATCDGCGTIGTVARTTRFLSDGRVHEQRRFCAHCWPEQYALFEAEREIERQQWFESVHHAQGDSSVSRPLGTEVADATWMSVLGVIQTALNDTNAQPSEQEWRQFTAMLIEMAPTRERYPPMPQEIAELIAKYGGTPPEPPSPISAARPTVSIADMTAAIHAAHAAADASIKAFETFTPKPLAFADVLHELESDEDVESLMAQTATELSFERDAMATETQRAARLIEQAQHHSAARALQRAEFHRQYITSAQELLAMLEGLRD